MLSGPEKWKTDSDSNGNNNWLADNCRPRKNDIIVARRHDGIKIQCESFSVRIYYFGQFKRKMARGRKRLSANETKRTSTQWHANWNSKTEQQVEQVKFQKK